MSDVKKYKNEKKEKFHLVLVCDETGIFGAFRIITEHLGQGEDNYLSLIYLVIDRNTNHLFEKELAILEKRFSHNLFTHTIQVEHGNYDSIQEYIEAIINSNTTLNMQFLIFGKYEFTDYVSGILRYLNVDTFSIES